jgi:hypothetical protein
MLVEWSVAVASLAVLAAGLVVVVLVWLGVVVGSGG